MFPDNYSTTNLETKVRLAGKWVKVDNPEMDCGLIVDDSGEKVRIYTLPMADVKAGMKVVCGADGIKVTIPLQESGGGSFGFMESDVSSEKPQAVLVRQVAEGMREAKAQGKKVLWVGGPGVVHTGAAPAMVALVNAGFVDVLSPATRWPPTTSSPRCTAPRSAWTSRWAAASSTATSTTSAR